MVEEDPDNIEYLKQFIASGYRLNGVESHEKDKEGKDKYFLNSLVGVVENGYLIGAWGTQLDITAQHEENERLAHNRELLTRALHVSQIGIWEWDVQKNMLTWDKGLRRLYGVDDDEEITFEKFIEKVHPDDRQRMLN